MPEAAGPANQSGICYQNSCAALVLGRLCDTRIQPAHERVIEVRVAAPSYVDDVQAVSYILTKQDDDTADLHEALVILGIVFVADNDAPEVLEPSNEVLNLRRG